ncbi:nucleoside triphosphate pyrophosphohydrolase, partial [Candidatus Parcubacteria bacterium]|nr:nucleoside triphosphate pyrophosphohydrolase [Candidatus Parcubacteria bacterium]
MKTIRYNKLVRDRIPEIIKRNGGVPSIGKLSSKRFIAELKKKLFEEGKELVEAKEKKDIAEELSDVLEILMAMATGAKLSWPTIEKIRKEKKKKRGGFDKRIPLPL